MNDTLGFLAVTRATINHPNRAKDITFPNMAAHQQLIDASMGRLRLSKDPVPAIMADLEASMMALIASLPSESAAQQLLWKYLGEWPYN